MKRFYKEVSVSAERGILLDGRLVRTPKKAVLTLPNDALADAVADEWRAQGDNVDPQTMKISGLANAAIDVIAPDCATFAASLAVYGESDLLCYRAEDPPELVARQNAEWNPLLDWAQARYDVAFTRVAGIMHRAQPRDTVARLAAAIGARGAFELAALSHLVTISGSLVIALAVIEREIDGEAAFDTAHLDELWQAEKWGEDYFAIQTREAHRADFLSAARFLHLLNG
jgi:chaperone required for assembly of F1-ATPase